MQNIEMSPSWGLGLKVWWAWFWRTMILVFVLSIIIGIIVGVIGALIGLAQATISFSGGLFGLAIGLYLGPAILKRLMTKGFGRYRLAVMRKD